MVTLLWIIMVLGLITLAGKEVYWAVSDIKSDKWFKNHQISIINKSHKDCVIRAKQSCKLAVSLFSIACSIVTLCVLFAKEATNIYRLIAIILWIGATLYWMAQFKSFDNEIEQLKNEQDTKQFRFVYKNN